MKYKILTLTLQMLVLVAFTQNSDKDFAKVYKRISSKRIFELNGKDKIQRERDSLEIVEMQQMLEFFNNFLTEEHKLNGKAGFVFSGNENDINNLFRVGVNGSIDRGAYPSELDFALNVQTTIQNGKFQENLSDIDVSYDFHPYIPKETGNTDGLWLENYVFVKRFNNNFLGIEQRYEIGLGFVFNLFTKKKLTEKGKNNLRRLEKIPQYEFYENDLKRCLEECYLKESVLQINENELHTILLARERYLRSNTKKYSKLRLALLIGIYYELENAFAKNEITFNGVDTILTESFTATNNLRWEFRPTIVWKPRDKYRLKVYPYFKMPFSNANGLVVQEGLQDIRYDYFVDMLTSFEIEVEQGFSIAINYRMLYDNAPKRKYLAQEDESFVLLAGQNRNSTFGIEFKFQF